MKLITLYPTLVPTDNIKIWEIHAHDKKELIFEGRVDELKLEEFIKIRNRQVFEVALACDVIKNTDPRTMHVTTTTYDPRIEIYIMEEI